MALHATVTYYYHSGFSLQVENNLLVFDYWEGTDGDAIPQRLKLTSQTLALYENVYVFISHAHPDHLDEVVFQWKDHPSITYIVSNDMPIGIRGKRLASGDQLRLSEKVRVSAYDSTDLGVSFMVDVAGLRVFHAGDLNLWHWREESTLREIEAAEQAYEEAVAPLNGQHIDICMFPVDPRMGYLFDAGAQHFILATKPRVFIPMHWQNRPEIAQDFARRARNKYSEVLPLTRPGEFAQITFEETGLQIQIVSPESATTPMVKVEKSSISPLISQESGTFSSAAMLGAYKEDDPFSDSDLPVMLDEEALLEEEISVQEENVEKQDENPSGFNFIDED